MAFIPFPEYRPDVDDYLGEHTQVLSGVLPRGDGYGPFPNLQAYTSTLPARCRGATYMRKSDGTVVIFAASINRIWTLNNSTLGWTPVSKVTALTSISNASPAVFTKTAHGLSVNDDLVLSTSGALPTGLTVGTIYYVKTVPTADTFTVSATVGGAAINTSSAGSGTHSMTYFYSDLPSTDQWQFAPFGDTVVAVQANSAPQAFNVASSVAFADLGGSPPTSRYVATVGRFLVLTGQITVPRRLQWSDLDGITTWTPGTGFANYFDLPDGGIVRGVMGGEFGFVAQESVWRRMVYVTGAKPAFQIDRIAEEKGLLGPYSIVRAGDKIFAVSQQGFQQITGQGLVPIGKERVDRTFLADLDTSNLQLLIGAGDPAGTRAIWAYKSVGNSNTSVFDKIIVYDSALDRWSPPISVTGEYLMPVVKPGLTLDSLDSISGSIDALGFTLDSVQAALGSKLSAFDSDHKLGFFDGANIEATLETAEQGIEGRRIIVRGFVPRTDAPTVYGRTRYRSNAQASYSQTDEALINSQGLCPQRRETKLARMKVRIPASTLWSYAKGVEPEIARTGKR